MSAVEIAKTADGYRVARYFHSLAAAQQAMSRLLEINEAAFMPVCRQYEMPPGQAGEDVRKLMVQATDILRDAAEADDLPPHDGRNPPAAFTGD
jgi:hypothetical protein